MQIDGSHFEVAMAEQDLNGAQVRSGFEKVCGETMPQGVGMDAPVIEACAFSGDLTGRPEDLGGHRTAGCVPAVSGKQPLLRLAPEAAPVSAQLFEQLRTEHDIAVLAALALVDMNHHPLAVDVADLQAGRFCAAGTGGIERHQKDAMKGAIGSVDQTCYFLLAEYRWKMTHLLRIGRLGNAPASLQHVDVEKAQRRQPQDNGVWAVLQLGEEHRLILANILRTELIGRTTKVAAEMRNAMQVAADRGIGEVAAMQLLKHELTELVHRESPFSASQTPPAATKAGSATRGCVRRRSGFVVRRACS